MGTEAGNLSIQQEEKAKKNKRGLTYGTITRLLGNWQLYLMAVPAIVLLFAFSYMPMAGLVLAFRRFTFDGGIWGSPWADPWYRNF